MGNCRPTPAHIAQLWLHFGGNTRPTQLTKNRRKGPIPEVGRIRQVRPLSATFGDVAQTWPQRGWSCPMLGQTQPTRQGRATREGRRLGCLARPNGWAPREGPHKGFRRRHNEADQTGPDPRPTTGPKKIGCPLGYPTHSKLRRNSARGIDWTIFNRQTLGWAPPRCATLHSPASSPCLLNSTTCLPPERVNPVRSAPARGRRRRRLQHPHARLHGLHVGVLAGRDEVDLAAR